MHRTLRLAALVFCLVARARADLDLDTNGLGDVWEAKFQPASFVPAEDSDGDGRTNLEEFEAGTDPLRAEDVFSVREITPQGANLQLKWSSQAGKRYQIQTTTTPGTPASWVNLPGLHAGVAGELAVTTPLPGSESAFYRVVAADVDTDGDGLTDWEEIQAGYNPLGGNDLAALTAALESEPVITLATTDAEATEPTTIPAGDSGTFRVRRSGGIGRVVVSLEASGSASASDYQGLPTTVAIPLAATEVLVPLVPVADAVTESDELAVLSVTEGDYDLGAATSAGVLIKDSVQANGTGLRGEYWKHPHTTLNSPYFGGIANVAPNPTRIEPVINFDNATAPWPGSPITVGTASDHFSSRWSGEILPEFSQVYTIYTTANETSRIKINGQVLINRWPASVPPVEDPNWPGAGAPTGSEVSATISLEGGKRYSILMEHYNNTGGHRAVLSWASQSQTKQVIPQARLFPNTAPRILAPLEKLAFIGGPAFSHQIVTSGSPNSYSALNLPAGLILDEDTGLITGTPETAGEWKVMVTASNAYGSGSAFLNITVLQTSGGITRELWTEAPGATVAQIPVTEAPDSTSLLTKLEATADSGDEFGARLRGYLTAPETGEYRFYLRADEAAAFYLSDDEEPVNSWKRAELTGPVGSLDWSAAAQSPLLHLEAGKRYYLEVLHKESGGSDHLAVGWLTPSEMAKMTPVIAVVPGHVLTRFEDVTLGPWPTFTPPPSPPDWAAEPTAAHTEANAAARFLQQATFGADSSDITALQAMESFDEWIDGEFAKPVTPHLPYVEQFRNVSNPNNPTYPGTLTFSSWWKNSIQGDDQLRQRIAFALSEIMVVSESGPLDDRANAVSSYYDMLLQHSFGNVRDLLEDVTLHPAMGRYLDMLRNDKPSLSAGRIPNENYAREILQLFSLGLYRMHPDGTPMLNSKGELIPVYDQDSIIGYAHVFTGWGYNYSGAYRTTFPDSANWTDPMREVPARHYTGKKRLLNNIVLPGIPVLNGAVLNPYGDHSGSTIANNPEFQALSVLELDAVHDQLFQHPNIGPFLCSQLIQRLVTSTPTPGYVYRVASKFNDNGSGVRGDMRAVIKAILLDYEARSISAAAAPKFGKQREPVTRVTQLARAFRPANNFAGSYTQDGGLITVDTGAMAHRLASGQKVLLGFSGAGAQAQDGDYALFSTPPATTFTVRTRDILRGTWTQALAENFIRVTTPTDHGFATGQSAYLRFRTGAEGIVTNGVYPVTRLSNTTFSVAAPDFATRSGDLDVAWFRGGYSQTVTGGVPTLTVTCSTLPGLAVDSKMTLSFTASAGLPPTDGVYTITSISGSEPRRFILDPDVGDLSTVNNLAGTFNAAPHAPTLDRSGTVVSGYSDWNVGNTDTSLGQTPLASPTVFNFFVPDYKFPGPLADNGLVTPEFQLSSDTNVIRQANTLFGGIYHTTSTTSITSGYTNGFSAFLGGAHDIMMDFSPWMGLRDATAGNYWTNTANLRDLIRELSKILMAGQMSTGMEDQIYNFVSTITYNATTPTDAERRNRVRAIIYFIAVSPEHAIQR